MISRRAMATGALALTGDGLVKPVNAPRGTQTPPGVQAGVSQAVIVANQVIVFGPNGGVFVYSSSPGPGNLVASISATSGTDRYGNSVSAGFAVYSGATFAVMNSGALEIGDATSGTEFSIFGSVLSLSAVYGSPSFSVSIPVTCTSGTPSSPTVITTDTNNNASSLYVNNWSAAAVGTDLMYELMLDNTVQVSGRLANSTVGGISGSSAITSSLPAAYIPARDEPVYMQAHASASPFATTAGCFGLVRTTGIVEFFGTFSTTSTLEISGRYPLSF